MEGGRREAHAEGGERGGNDGVGARAATDCAFACRGVYVQGPLVPRLAGEHNAQQGWAEEGDGRCGVLFRVGGVPLRGGAAHKRRGGGGAGQGRGWMT